MIRNWPGLYVTQDLILTRRWYCPCPWKGFLCEIITALTTASRWINTQQCTNLMLHPFLILLNPLSIYPRMLLSPQTVLRPFPPHLQWTRVRPSWFCAQTGPRPWRAGGSNGPSPCGWCGRWQGRCWGWGWSPTIGPSLNCRSLPVANYSSPSQSHTHLGKPPVLTGEPRADRRSNWTNMIISRLEVVVKRNKTPVQ